MNNIYLRYQEGLIKSLIAQPEMMSEVVQLISSDEIENPNYKLVFEAIMDLYLAKEPISLSGIVKEIGDKGAGVDPAWVLQLDSDIHVWVSEGPPTVWASLLKKQHAMVYAQRIASKAAQALNAPGAGLEEIANSYRELEDIFISASQEDKYNLEDSIEEYMLEREREMNGDRTQNVIYSPYPSIDHYVGGWKAAEVITVGARTSVGKTVFATNVVQAALSQGKSTLFFSLEMTEKEVYDRFVSSGTMIPMKTLSTNAPFTEEQAIQYKEYLEELRQSKFHLETNSSVTIESIRAKATVLSQSEDGLDFIVIDYLQLIENRRQRNRQEAIAEISREMKKLAKDLAIPIMVLVQMKREENPEEADIPPQMHQIRESGAIAQDSSVVIVLHRNILKDAEVIDPKTLFIINKNRQGEVGKYINVRTRVDCNLFVDDTNPSGVKQRQMLTELAEREGLAEGGEDYYSNHAPDLSTMPSDMQHDFSTLEFADQFEDVDFSDFDDIVEGGGYDE